MDMMTTIIDSLLDMLLRGRLPSQALAAQVAETQYRNEIVAHLGDLFDDTPSLYVFWFFLTNPEATHEYKALEFLGQRGYEGTRLIQAIMEFLRQTCLGGETIDEIFEDLNAGGPGDDIMLIRDYVEFLEQDYEEIVKPLHVNEEFLRIHLTKTN